MLLCCCFVDYGWDPSSVPGSDPSSDPGSDLSSDPGFILSLSQFNMALMNVQ